MVQTELELLIPQYQMMQGTAGDADVPGDNVTDNNNSVSGALGEGVEELGDGVADGVRDVGEGVGNAVEDVGDAVDNAANGR